MARDVFQRKEIKYLMNDAQYRELRRRLEPIAEVDAYGETQILNTYFDTPGFKLIRRAMEHPRYKEKLRLRCYGIPSDDSPSFIEIKKKFEGIVYKRRIEVPYLEAQDYLWKGVLPPEYEAARLLCDASRTGDNAAGTSERAALPSSGDMACASPALPAQQRRPGHIPGREELQIQKEIDYFLAYYRRLRPAMGIAYNRIAMVGREDPELRITFDTDLRWSREELDLREGIQGHQILAPDQHLMEIKIMGSMDLRIAHMLSDLGIFHTSISKYGRGFQAYVEELEREQQKVCVLFARPRQAQYA